MTGELEVLCRVAQQGVEARALVAPEHAGGGGQAVLQDPGDRPALAVQVEQHVDQVPTGVRAVGVGDLRVGGVA